VIAVRSRTLGLGALVVAVAALAGTIAYAATRGPDTMMSRSGFSMMGSSGQRSAWYLDGSGPVRDLVAARARAQRFADRLGLRTGEVMQFENNFYVRLDDKAGTPATEVLVDPRGGDVTLEYGAAMMWNTRYGTMGRSGGMMGRYGSGVGRGSGPVDASGARGAADRWLAGQGIDARAGEPEAFPGYYTMETVRDGKVTGMISVDARSGAVLYHWWHGCFVAAEE
jgi:hypothetical protein